MRLQVTAALLLLSAACGGEAPLSDYATPTYAELPDGEALDLSGTWAWEVVQGQEVGKLFGEGTDPQTVFAWRLVERTDGGDGSLGWQPLTTCLIYTTEVSNTATTFSDGYYADALTTPAVAQVSAAEPGASFTLPEQVELFGVALEDPRGDPLPTEPDDPRVFDLDLDGHPG